jgi:hypothetical protein
MNVKWDLNDDGVMELPMLTGFSIAVLPQATLAVQLRCGPDDLPGGRRLQIGLSADAVRELAAGLLEAAERMGDSPGVGRLN